MDNIRLYFDVLETLKFKDVKDLSYYQKNIDVIVKSLQIDPQNLSNLNTLKELNFPHLNINDYINSYAYLLVHCCSFIISQIDFNTTEKIDLISVREMDLLTSAIQEAATILVCPNLPSLVQSHPIFESLFVLKKPAEIRNEMLPCGLKFIQKIFEINSLALSSTLDLLKLQGMIAAFCIISGREQNNRDDVIFALNFLEFLWQKNNKIKYFRNLLILKAIPYPATQKILHRNLLRMLQEPQGFTYLLHGIVPHILDDVPNWKRFDVISTIVANKKHSQEFHENLIKQIFKFLSDSIPNKNIHCYIPAGIVSLKKLYELNGNLKIMIDTEIESNLIVLLELKETLVGIILLENEEILNIIEFLNFLFCVSHMESLPSKCLIQYIPVLLQMIQQLPKDHPGQLKLQQLLIHCLINREKNELQLIFEELLTSKSSGNFQKFKYLHPRVCFIYDEKYSTVRAQVGPEKIVQQPDFSFTLTSALKSSSNNILIYNSFITLLRIFEEENFQSTQKMINVDLLHTEDELQESLMKNFQSYFAIISSLTDLVEFKDFHCQFQENPEEILKFIKNSLENRIAATTILHNDKEKCSINLANDNMFSIVLAIFQEIIESSKDQTQFEKYIKTLRKLLERNLDEVIKLQIENLINIINGNNSENSKKKKFIEKSKYKIARCLIEENQPHLKVYGIVKMIKLFQGKDEETLTNKHAVLALAFQILREEDSYTFLNCIRLFVCLIDVLEAEVFEMLSEEYLSVNEKIDFRLKVGEAILKVTEYLGGLSFKYRSILINCFLNGCRLNIDELRCSSLSNLATLCRLLSYQVHYFFQEMLLIIESILTNDKYIPAKRAAVLILSQLLCGIDNLIDFQEYLLPVYRLLKNISESEIDEMIKIHANNGLNSLGEKCKEFLKPELKMQKEIQIFGIKDTKKKTNNILKLN